MLAKKHSGRLTPDPPAVRVPGGIAAEPPGIPITQAEHNNVSPYGPVSQHVQVASNRMKPAQLILACALGLLFGLLLALELWLFG
jgi:hypothetical protein